MKKEIAMKRGSLFPSAWFALTALIWTFISPAPAVAETAAWKVATVHGINRFAIESDGTALRYQPQPTAEASLWYWHENNGYPANILATHPTATGPANHPDGKTADPVRAGCRTFAVTDVAVGQKLNALKLVFDYQTALGYTTINFFITDGAGNFAIFAPTSQGLAAVAQTEVLDETWSRMTLDLTRSDISDDAQCAIYENNVPPAGDPFASKRWGDIKNMTIAGMYDYQRSPTGGWGAWGTMFSAINRVGVSALSNGYGLALIWGDTVGGAVYPFQERVIRNVTVTFGGTDYVASFESAQIPSRWVNPAYNSSTPGWGVTAFATIQSAINAATAGDTISVAAGVYPERIVVDKSVALKGASAGISKFGYVVPPSYAYDPNTESIIRPADGQAGVVVNITAPAVTVDGFIIANEHATTSGDRDLVALSNQNIDYTDVQLINNVIGPNQNTADPAANKGRMGISVYGPSASKVKLTIRGNKIFDANGDGCGILLLGPSVPQGNPDLGQTVPGTENGWTGKYSGSVIEENEIEGNHRSGIELAGGCDGGTDPANYLKIINNTIKGQGMDTGDAPANLKYGHGIVIIRTGSTTTYPEGRGACNVLIAGNAIQNNEKSGIYIGPKSKNIEITGNQLVNNGNAGAPFGLWDGIRIDLNESYHSGALQVLDFLEDIEISGNVISGNGDFGVRVIETPSLGAVNAAFNWWGAANGPGTVGPGSGDKVSANVDFSPWWGNETMTQYGAVWVDDDFNSSTPGWGEYKFAKIQDGVNAVASGGTVHVAAGTYVENVVTTVPLAIVGAGQSTVVAPAGGTAIALAAGTDAARRSVLRNLRVQGAGTGIAAGGFTTLDGVTSTGHSSYGINLASGQDLIVTGCHFDGNAVGLKLSSSASFSHITISGSSFDNNTQHGWYSDASSSVKPDLDAIAITATSFSGNGLKGFYTERLSNATFDNLTVRDNANSSAYAWGAGVDVNLKWKAYSGITIRNSSFANNGRGSANGVALTIKARDDGSTYGAIPATLDGVTVTGCDFDANERDIYFGEPAKNNAGPTGVAVSRCRFPNPAVAALLNHSQAVVNGERNYWGHATGPTHASNPGGAGSAIGDRVTYSPWYADVALTLLATADSFEDRDVAQGQTETFDDLYVGAGATWTVRGTLEVTGKLTIAEGGSIEVIDGELVLGAAGGGTHTMAGTFVVYNSFGSIEILEDTEFSGDALMLISDIHVADGVTLTVSGSLILDGCTVDCLDAGGRFAIEVVSGGTLTMERTQLFDADLTLEGNGSLVRNNQLTNVAATVNAGAANNAVYHNVFLGTTALTDNGTGTITTLDGWGNVASLAATQNDLALALTLTGLGPNRTLDAAGNLYVQPGDLVRLNLNVAKLLDKIQGVEAMLGFNNDYFDPSLPSSLGGVAPWIYELHNLWATDGAYGKIDTAIGLDFAYPDPEGTSSDSTVAAIALQTRALEGVTQVYFRPRLPDDHPLVGNRLTGFKGVATFVFQPFTLNTGYITVDGTDPLIDNFTATQTQEGGAVDVFGAGAIAHQGTVAFTVDATDALAGIDDADVILTLTLQSDPGVTLTAALAGKTTVEVGGVSWTRYTFTTEIVAATRNGTYDAAVKVLDRSGNVSDELVGAFTVQKNQVSVTVELQGGAAGPFTRDVVFTAANAALGELKVWTKTVSFTDGVGTVTLLEAPDGMAFLDAKTDWTLRVRVACAPDGDGQSVADFAGANQLPGGDLNGDNRANMLDYSILRYFWFTAEPRADITGNGNVDLLDFNILKANWYGAGAPAAIK